MKKEINKFYKEIKLLDSDHNEYMHTLFDYEKIWQDDAPIFLIISERGAKGKSTQGKYLARKIWDDHNLKSMWLMNTQILIDKEKKSHLAKPKQFLSDTFNAESRVLGDYVYDDKLNDTKTNWYTKFASLSTAENEKGSRDDYGLVIYDEFNVGLGMIKNKQVDLLSSLIGTLTDPVNLSNDRFKKFIIHGNFKSLNNQFLIDLGVLKIEDEITDVYVGDFLLMRILCPKMTDGEKHFIKDKNKGNWKYLLQEKLGKADHVYFNENLFDDVNNVNTWMLMLPVISSYLLKIRNYTYRVSVVKSKDWGNVIYIHMESESTKSRTEKVFVVDKSDIKENVVYNVNMKHSLIEALMKNKVYFQSAADRENVIDCLRK